MTLAPSLRTAPQQRQVLAPAVRASLAVLRMPLADLQAEIAREVADNPFLRWRRPAGTAAELPRALAAAPSLLDDLRTQIGLMPLAPEVRAMAEHLAGELRDDGYLDAPLEEIAAELGVPMALAEAWLAALQGCEPAGVGARDLSECLTLQLVDRGLPAAQAAAVVARLEGFVTGDWRGLGRALGLEAEALRRIAALLPGLVAHPVVPAPPAPPLIADLVAEPRPGGGHAVRLAREAAPRLVLDRAMLARAAGEPMAAACRARAEALIAAVRARGETLVRIGVHLAEAQHAAFTHGLDRLRPLRRAEVAATLGLHPSTVGRAVAGKAIALQGRVLPLAQFFAVPLPQAEGPALAGLAVRRRIARLVAAEPPEAPLSDEAIRRALAADGVDIARRTVAKYREWIRLPASHQRRRTARLRADGGGGAAEDAAERGAGEGRPGRVTARRKGGESLRTGKAEEA